MPAGYEYNLDHRVIDAAAWDIVTLVDLETYFEEAAQLPNDLRGAVEYLDLSEAVTLQVELRRSAPARPVVRATDRSRASWLGDLRPG